MSTQNTIYKGYDNPVIMEFTFGGDFAALGLNNFTSIDVKVGTETHSTIDGKVEIVSATELALKIGDSTALAAGSYQPIVVGYNATYDDGYVLTMKGSAGLGALLVVA